MARNRGYVCMIGLVLIGLLGSVTAQDCSPSPAPEESDASTGSLILRFASIIVLILLSGLFSGLTLGLLGLDTNQLLIVAEAGLPKERVYAQKIYPVRKKGNLLLCTLLLGNVAVNALLSILLADLTGGLVGFLVSTALIVIFGEIVPQAACSRFALYIGAKAIPLVRIIIVLLFVAAWPISKCLDYALGQEIGTYYTKDEFMKLLKMHMNTDRLNKDEVAIMSGAMTLQDKTVHDIMTPIEKAFTLKSSDKLDYTLMCDIFKSGHSRIPVWDEAGENIVGLLFSKDLILIVPANCTPVITVVQFFERDRVNYVFEDDSLEELLKTFHDVKQQLALVQTVDNSGPGDPFYRVTGLVTLEDLLEEILQREFVDEHDRFVSNQEDKPLTDRPEYEYEHLRLLDASRGYNDLTPMEIRAMAAHLKQNVKAFKELGFASIEELVKGSRVMDLVAPPGAASTEARPDELLYIRGDVETVCTIIIHGRMELLIGNDGIRSEMGPWDVMAEKALLASPGDYKVDFSARRITASTRVLRVTQADYATALKVSRPIRRDNSARSARSAGSRGSGGGASASAGETKSSGPAADVTGLGLFQRDASLSQVTPSVALRDGLQSSGMGLVPRPKRERHRSRTSSAGSAGGTGVQMVRTGSSDPDAIPETSEDAKAATEPADVAIDVGAGEAKESTS